MLLELVLRLPLKLKETFATLRQVTSSVAPAMTNSEFRGAMSPGNR